MEQCFSQSNQPYNDWELWRLKDLGKSEGTKGSFLATKFGSCKQSRTEQKLYHICQTD
jgi:hypothetical protein